MGSVPYLHLIVLLVIAMQSSLPAKAALLPIRPDPSISNTVQRVLAQFTGKARPSGKTLSANQIALTLLDVDDPQAVRGFSHRGSERIYPASVVKLFYLAATHQWLEEGRIQDSEELQRALRLMIVDSWNEATHYVVDVLTATTSGPELDGVALEEWWEKRNAVNRYFQGLGYSNVVANRKPWCEGPFGREQQSAKLHAPHRNLLSTDDTAQLLVAIHAGKMVSAARSQEMLQLLRRDPVPKANDPESQVKGFVGEGLSSGSKLWSKAGWTSQTRHDAALVELPGGRKRVLVVFTVDHAQDETLIPELVRALWADGK